MTLRRGAGAGSDLRQNNGSCKGVVIPAEALGRLVAPVAAVKITATAELYAFCPRMPAFSPTYFFFLATSQHVSRIHVHLQTVTK